MSMGDLNSTLPTPFTFLVKNSGNVPLRVQSVSLSNEDDFRLKSGAYDELEPTDLETIVIYAFSAEPEFGRRSSSVCIAVLDYEDYCFTLTAMLPRPVGLYISATDDGSTTFSVNDGGTVDFGYHDFGQAASFLISVGTYYTSPTVYAVDLLPEDSAFALDSFRATKILLESPVSFSVAMDSLSPGDVAGDCVIHLRGTFVLKSHLDALQVSQYEEESEDEHEWDTEISYQLHLRGFVSSSPPVVCTAASREGIVNLDNAPLDFGTVMLGEVASITIACRAGSTTGVYVSETIVPNDLEWEDVPISDPDTLLQGVLTLSSDTPLQVGDTERFIIQFNNFESVVASFPVHGQVAGEFSLLVKWDELPVNETSLIDFGDVRTGETISSTISIENDGSIADSVLAIRLDNIHGRFSVQCMDSFPMLLSPSDYVNCILSWSPDISEMETADLVVQTQRDEYRIHVIGNSVNQPRLSIYMDGEEYETSATVSMETFYLHEVETTLLIGNHGSAPLILRDIEVGPNYQVVFDEQSDGIRPGDSFPLIIRCNADTVGAVPTILSFLTNDPDRSNITIFVSTTIESVGRLRLTDEDGNVLPKDATVPFPSTRIDSPVTVSFIVHNFGSEILTLSGFSDMVRYRYNGNDVVGLQPGASDSLVVTNLADEASISWEETFSWATNDPAWPRVSVNLVAEVIAEPEMRLMLQGGTNNILDHEGFVDFGRTTLGSPVRVLFVILNDGKADLVLSSIDVPSGFSVGFSFQQNVVGQGGSTTFSIVLTAEEPGVYEGPMYFHSSDPNYPVATITLRGEVVALPAFRLCYGGMNRTGTVSRRSLMSSQRR